MAKTPQAANRTRAQKAKALHDKKTTERKDEIQSERAIFKSEESKAVLEIIVSKCKRFQEWHTKIAQDGVGARETGYKLADGTKEVENVFLTPVQRVSHLDKNAGIQEILDFIDRMLAEPKDLNPKGV